MSSIIKVDTIQTAAGGVPTAGDLGLNITGSVLQVVQANFASNSIVSSTTWSATAVEASITPTSSNNKIFISIYSGVDTNTTNRNLQATIYRNNTLNLYQGASPYFGYAVNNTGRIIIPVLIQYTDSPATTSSVTYTLYHRSGGSYQTEMPGTFQTQQITLMEIAG